MEDPEARSGLNSEKYIVRRGHWQGGPNTQVFIDSKKHEKCDYFVLDLVHDKFARPALEAYIATCEKEFPLLAEDLRARLERMKS